MAPLFEEKWFFIIYTYVKYLIPKLLSYKMHYTYSKNNTGNKGNNMNKEALKRQAGVYAAGFVENDMIVGLGTGSTVYYTLVELARRIKHDNLKIKGIPTSKATEKIAKQFRIPLTTLVKHPFLDITIDGADEVDPELNLIKGGGGALLREKIVANASVYEIIVVDEDKLVENLGTKMPLPVETFHFGHNTLIKRFMWLGARPFLRSDKETPIGIFITDSGNIIYDLHFDYLDDPFHLEREINNIPGVVDNGLFLDLTTMAVVAGKDGIEIIE